MKISSLSALGLFVSTAVLGCAAAPGQEPSSISSSSEALTIAECGTQRDECLGKNRILGFLTCPAQYATCVANADNGLPAQVTQAIADAAECRRSANACVNEASSPGETLACREDEAQCVAAIVDVQIPKVVEGTAACVNSAVDCIDASERASDLVACADTLRDCANGQIENVLPPEVKKVVGDINTCARTLNACIGDAGSPSAIAACNEGNVQCVAKGLDVTLPNIPVSKALSCAENAAKCTVNATSIEAVRTCARGLNDCAAAVVDSVEVPQNLTCEQKWTACMVQNPLNFLRCGAELGDCRD